MTKLYTFSHNHRGQTLIYALKILKSSCYLHTCLVQKAKRFVFSI